MNEGNFLRHKESYIENDYVEMWIEEGIIMEIFKPEITHITLEAAKLIVEDRLKISNKITRPIYIDFANARSVDKDAREYVAMEEALAYISAAGFLMHNYMHWIAGKLFLTINTPKVKIELFRSRAKAIEWLKHYRNVN